MTIGWPLFCRLSCFPSGTNSLWYSGDVAKRIRVSHHEVMPYSRRRRSATANPSRNNIEVQGCRAFDVREVMAEVIGVGIQAGFGSFGSIFGAQFASGVERDIHFAVVQRSEEHTSELQS